MKKKYFAIRDWIYRHLPAIYINLHLLRVWLQGGDKYQRRLERGAFWLERGTRFQVGQPVKYKRTGRVRVKYIANLFYDFRRRKITASYSDRPIPGWSEPFLKKRSKGVKPQKRAHFSKK